MTHRQRRYRLLAALTLIAALLALSACRAKGTEETLESQEAHETQDMSIPAWQRYANEEITLDWYVHFSWFSTTWGNDVVAQKITEETGVRVNFVPFVGDEVEKLASLVSSNALPDIITIGFWEPQVEELILGDYIYPLNELADEYDLYFWEVAQPQRIAWYTRSDGSIFAYPNSSYTPKDYENNDKIGSNQSFLVRADIYEAIGSPNMSTPEGFKNAIRDAFEYMPTVDGKPLLAIGLSEFNTGGNHSLDEILMNFLAIPFEKDGEIYDRVSDPDYIMWLKALRELYAEGYISNELFIDRRVQMVEKVAQGRYFCMLYQHADIADQQIYRHSRDPNGVYIAVEGPKNSNGDNHRLPGTGINGWTVTMISKSCESPQRAIALMSYMLSEHGQKILYCGIEGVTYDHDESGNVVFRDEVLELLSQDRIEYNRLYSGDNTYWMLQDNAMQLKWQLTPQAPLAQPREWTYPYTEYIVEYDVSITEPVAMDANWRIKNEWGGILPQLFTAPTEEDFDRLYESFLQARWELGYDIVLAEWVRLLDEAKLRLGVD